MVQNRRNRRFQSNRNNRSRNALTPIIRQRRNRTVQNVTTASHRDATIQVRRCCYLQEITLATQAAQGSIRVNNINVSPTSSALTDWFKAMAQVYEEYRITRIRIFASLGENMNVDDKIKVMMVSRVDVDAQYSNDTPNTIQSLLNSQNSNVSTFSQKNRMMLCDYRPVNVQSAPTVQRQILPPQLQWYGTSPTQLGIDWWRGATIAAFIPGGAATDDKKLTLTVSCDVAFRGRATIPLPSTSNINLILRDVDDDDENRMSD